MFFVFSLDEFDLLIERGMDFGKEWVFVLVLGALFCFFSFFFVCLLLVLFCDMIRLDCR